MVIVAAVDRSGRAPAVLDQATTLADQFGEPLHLIHVMTRSEAIDAETTGISKDEGVEISEVCAVAAGVVTDLLKDHPVSVETTETGRIGDSADEIIEYAEGHDARYIVVGLRQRSQTRKITSTRTRRGKRSSPTIPRSVSTRYAYNWEEHVEGYCGIAVPIRPEDEVLGALALGEPIERIKNEQSKEALTQRLRETGNEFELELKFPDL